MSKPSRSVLAMVIRSVAGYIILFGSLIGFGALVQIVIGGRQLTPLTESLYILAYGVLVVAAVTGAVYLICRWEHCSFRSLFSDTGFSDRGREVPHVLAFLGGIAVAFGAALLGGLGFWLAFGDQWGHGYSGVGTGTEFVGWLISTLVAVFLSQGFIEELLFRGWLHRTSPFPAVGTVVWTSTAFALMHVVSEGGQETVLDRIVYLLIPFSFGTAASVMRHLTGSLWACVGVHSGLHLISHFVPWIPSEHPGIGGYFIEAAAWWVVTVLLLFILRRRAGETGLGLG